MRARFTASPVGVMIAAAMMHTTMACRWYFIRKRALTIPSAARRAITSGSSKMMPRARRRSSTSESCSLMVSRGRVQASEASCC